MTTTDNVTSLESYRNQQDNGVLIGLELGRVERRYGLMSSEEPIYVAEIIATSGDLAVADRLAFLAAIERRELVIVIAFAGEYVACTSEQTITSEEISGLIVADGAPRIMSVVSDRGITPALGPLSA